MEQETSNAATALDDLGTHAGIQVPVKELPGMATVCCSVDRCN